MGLYDFLQLLKDYSKNSRNHQKLKIRKEIETFLLSPFFGRPQGDVFIAHCEGAYDAAVGFIPP